MAKKDEIREAQLIRAARLKAELIALLNQDPNAQFTANYICSKLENLMEELNYNNSNVYSHLHYMADQGLIFRGTERATFCAKAPANVAQNKQIGENPKIKEKKKFQNPAKMISVEIVKSTGKVRLEIQGLIIEIGVVND